MKTPHILKAVLPVVLGIITQAAMAQHSGKTDEKQEFRIKIVKVENGKTFTIDTVFTNHADLEKFHRENMAKLDLPPDPHPFTIKIDDENIEDEIVINGDDTIIKHRIVVHKLRGDSLHDVLKFIPGNELHVLRNPDTAGGKQVRMVKIVALLNVKVDEPVREELNNNANTEIKNSVNEKPLTVNNLKVYPNPGNGELTVEFEIAEMGTTQLLVTDLQGKEIYKEDFTSNGTGLQTRQLDLTRQPNGFYLLKIKSGDKSVVKKLVISGGE